MLLTIYRKDADPIEIEASRLRIECGQDHFEMREHGGLLVRIEEHDGIIEPNLAVFPTGGNSVRLKGGLR